MRADLHVHTTASDGEWSPGRVVEEAARLGLSAIGITDHDTTDGLGEAMEVGRRFGLPVIPGVEMSTEWEEEEVHILGYFLAPGEPALEAALRKMREARLRRASRIVKRLQSLGYLLSFPRVRELAGEGALGRPHIGRAMREAGYVESLQEAFAKFLKKGAPGFVPRLKLTPEETIAFLRQVGAVTVLAHPGSSSCLDLLPSLVRAGLQGLEVSYPEHSLEEERQYRCLAAEFNLAVSGGSDFHGPEGKRCGLGRWGVEAPELEALAKLKTGITFTGLP